MSVLIETTLGDLTVDLFTTQRPKCCLNFLKLCKLKYYNMCLFHSIEEGYIAQTGDPTGSGHGGESIFGVLYGPQARYFEKEDIAPKMRHTRRGLLAMVNNGGDAHGSQFYVTLADDGLDYLDAQSTIFGAVVDSDDVLQKLNDAICDEEHMPYIDIRITHTHILHDPFDDPKSFAAPSRSPSPTDEMLKSCRIGVDEVDDPDDDKTEAERAEEREKKEAKAQATILEMIGDLKDADEAPPDNVLFVCKLNAVTTDEDLEIIFSRFGEIVCCEIIRDQRTGNSLNYAFIEFKTEKVCEAAYLKMDNVLIDDRRIHVDFSQSVSKTHTWDKKGNAKPSTKAESKKEFGLIGGGRNGQNDKDSRPRPERRDSERRKDDRSDRQRDDDRRRRHDDQDRDRRRGDRHDSSRDRRDRDRHDDRHRSRRSPPRRRR